MDNLSDEQIKELANKEIRRKQKMKEWVEANKDKMKTYLKEWKANNKDKVKAYNDSYRKKKQTLE
jgi:hypothetical protein